MRYVVYGAGAIGGLLGGSLVDAGHEVVLIARGEHYQVMAKSGLRIDSPAGSRTVDVHAVEHPDAISWRDDDVVLLCMKSQHTEDALHALSSCAPRGVAMVSVQNGVANERAALRHFAGVYGVCVMCPAVHLEPGVVEAGSAPISGLLDIGCYPSGVDSTAESIAAAFGAATFESVPRADVMRWKYGKLLNNLGNALDALCGRAARQTELAERVRSEGVSVLDAAGIPFVDRQEDGARRGDRLRPASSPTVPAPRRPGSSSWQSLARSTGSIEADYLNGEIVLLGREHRVPTPVNEMLQRTANRAAREGWPPGSKTVDDLIPLLADRTV